MSYKFKVCLKKTTSEPKSVITITTNNLGYKAVDMLSCFDNEIAIPNVSTYGISAILSTPVPWLLRSIEQMRNSIMGDSLSIGIQRCLNNIETANMTTQVMS